MPPAGGAIGSRCATHGTIHRARRAIRWCAAVPPAWPAAASATAARIRHRSTGRRTRHPRPDVAFLVSRPSHSPNMLMLSGIDSHSTCTFKHTFKTASQVTRDAGVDLLHPPDDLGHRVLLVAILHRFELAAVDRNNGTSEELEPTAKLDELSAHRPDRRAIVLAEVGNRLEVRRQPPDQPHQFDIALRFSFQPPARLKAVEVAVEVDLQQRRGMIARPSRRRRRHP